MRKNDPEEPDGDHRATLPQGRRIMGMKTQKPHAPMHEGPEAFERFQQAVKAVLRVPKSALPPSPFGQIKKQSTESVK